MRLSAWILELECTEADLSRQLGVAISTVNRMRNGVTMPEASLIARIVELTAGKVTANDLFDAYQDAHSDPQGRAA